MACAQVGWALGRVKRIGEQKEGFSYGGVARDEDRGLAAAVGMATDEDAAFGFTTNGYDGCAEASLVALGAAARRRTGGAGLAEGKIAAKNSETGGAESFGQCDEQGSLAVGAGAMRQYQTVRRRLGRAMKKAADGEIGG